MNLLYSTSFKKDYKKLAPIVQNTTDKKLKILVDNPYYPSLRVKKVQGHDNIFEGSVTKKFRFIFQITSEGLILLRIGPHDILEKLWSLRE